MAFTAAVTTSSSAASARSFRPSVHKAGARARSLPVSAVATEVAPARVFSDEEWAQASKEAAKLAAEFAAASAASGSAGSTAADIPPPGRVFSDAEWSKAFELAQSKNPLLYSSVAVTGEVLSVSDDESTPAYPSFPAAPEGRAFSDEEWQYAFTQAAKGLEAVVASASTTGYPAPPEGRTFSDAEWTDAFKAAASGKLEEAEVLAPKSFGDVMAFSGPGPETINGRLAMLAFLAAVSAELSSGVPAAVQYAEASGGVLATTALFTLASLVPLLKGVKAKSVGPFTVAAEKLNGRGAMVGFASLVLVESMKGSPLF